MAQLKQELAPQEYDALVRAHCVARSGSPLRLYVSDLVTRDWIREKLLDRIVTLARMHFGSPVEVRVELGWLKPGFNFETHVESKSNQLARAAAREIGENPGLACNPLHIFGSEGVGRTHLMHAAGNLMLERHPHLRVACVHSEQFWSDMVSATRRDRLSEFRRFYRTCDALLIDDIQFLFGKGAAFREELLSTFDALLDYQRQIVATSDRSIEEFAGMQERMVSLSRSGLSVAVEPPDRDARAVILTKKAASVGVVLPDDVTAVIADYVPGNVRELEGTLNRLIATSRFIGCAIDRRLTEKILKDSLAR